MKRLVMVTVFAAVVLLAGVGPAVVATAGGQESTCAYPVTLTDATGTEVRIESEPERVVAMFPSDAQTAFEIGAGEKVVGMPISQYTAYLDVPASVEDVSDESGAKPVTERVIGVEPDVVLAANTAMADTEQIDQLRDAGVSVYVFDVANSIEAVTEHVLLTGTLTGECVGARETVDWMDERLDRVDDALRDRERPLVYYAMGSGYTPGSGTFQNEVLMRAGAENLGDRAGIEQWGQLSEEVIVEEDPDWIVYDHTFDEPPVGEAARTTTAWEDQQVATVDSNYVSQPGPRVVLAVEALAETFHPDRYDAPEQTNAQPEDDAFAIPGFTVAGALLGLVGTIVLRGRR